MNIKLIACLLLISSLKSTAQQEPKGTSEFSLQGSIDYALKHNVNYLNAEADILQTKYKKNEITGIGLPQINGSADLKDYIELPTSLLPGQFFGAPAGTFIPVRFGTQYNATAGISVSQLLFSSDYILGVQAAKEFSQLAEKNLQRSKAETVQNVSKAYYMVLVNRERIKLLDANIGRLKKLLDDLKAYNKEGFVEKIDVDRIEVTYNNLITEKTKTERLIGLSESLLKFQMGYKINDPISLSDKLIDNVPESGQIGEDAKINYSNRPEYALLESQRTINTLDLRRNRMAYLPSLVSYGAWNYNAQRTQFDLFDASKKWFPIGIIGATLNVPIFDGLQKHWKIEQAKVALMKTNNTLHGLELAIDMETTSASVAYNNALASMETQKKNMALAQSIYDVSEKKYQQGIGSNVELLNAQTSLTESQTNYYNALYDMLIARIDYMKATGTLVK